MRNLKRIVIRMTGITYQSLDYCYIHVCTNSNALYILNTTYLEKLKTRKPFDKAGE